MSFDCSRFTFNPWHDYHGVVMQQGRVQLDSDWNEWLAEFNRRVQAGTLDIFGRAAYPQATCPDAFRITTTANNFPGTPLAISIGPGRMYVDGLLVENHGPWKSATWDPALAEKSGAPQPPPATAPSGSAFTKQPYYPQACFSPSGSDTAVSTGTPGTYLFYLDVWIRPVTYLEHSNLVDKAVGVDTTGRLQIVWQVKTLSVPAATTCSTLASITPPWPPAPSSGVLSTGLASAGPSGPCCLTPGTSYTGQENQLYRVEIHNGSSPGPATFKWSRENASVATLVTAITTNGVSNSAGVPTNQLAVQSMGRDQVLGFAPGNWIEITDDVLELSGQPGELHKIDSIDASAKTITLVDPLTTPANFPLKSGLTDPGRHTRIIRWDQAGQISIPGSTTAYADLDANLGEPGEGVIPVPAAGTTLLLENGITVAFGAATPTYNTGDFWTFAARAADGSVEQLDNAPPAGIYHHYAPLTVLAIAATGTATGPDCRTPWPPECDGGCGGCCTRTVGLGAQYSSIQAAINSLPPAGGEICILPGIYYENLLIQNQHDVVLKGCGWQTRIASQSLQSSAAGGATSPAASTPGTGSGVSQFSAVIAITGSQHVELRSFVVEAAPGDVGILLDGTGTLITPPAASATTTTQPSGQIPLQETTATESERLRDLEVIEKTGPSLTISDSPNPSVKLNPAVIDTTIKELVLAGSDLPAILAYRVELLRIENNRIAVENRASHWPAVYLSGKEIQVEHNWVGVLSAATLREWLPASLGADLLLEAQDLAAGADPTMTKTGANGALKHPGGIMIAGPAEDVFIIENEIEGGSRNGITLGSFTVLDEKGGDTGLVTGLIFIPEGPCTTTGSLSVPLWPNGSGQNVVAGERLLHIQINRNRIRNQGLCGIGPVGFFNLTATPEVIAIEDLAISGNVILDTLQRSVEPGDAKTSALGYGAISLPSVEGLIIRDNAITNFGAIPGLDVCGIFLLFCEMVEISRNQVLETRDWTNAPSTVPAQTYLPEGGIVVGIVTPPSFESTTSAPGWNTNADLGTSDPQSVPVFEPGLPALRVEHNVVRVPLGEALTVIGLGPFSIVNNHFGCGGTVVDGTGDVLAEIAQTVLILNLGLELEFESSVLPGEAFNVYSRPSTGSPAAGISYPSSGAVLFTNNICQVEKRINTLPAFASVFIYSPDHIIFANNHCWCDALPQAPSLAVDAFLMATTLQVTGNRFQEAVGSVLVSGLTIGMFNLTSYNIATYCLIVLFPPALVPDQYNNLCMLPLLADFNCLTLSQSMAGSSNANVASTPGIP